MNYRSILIASMQTIGLFVAGFVIPLIGQLLALFTPVPLILIYVRSGRMEGFLTLAASSAVIAALGGWQAAAVLLLSFGLMAIGTAEGLRRDWKPEQTSLLGGLLPIAVVGAMLAVYLVKVGKNPVLDVEIYLRESIAAATKTYTSMGLTEVSAMIGSIPDSYIYSLARLIPSIIIATSIMQAACCFGITREIIKRKPGSSTALPPVSLTAWYAPDIWVWGLIATLAFIAIPHDTIRFTGWNLAIIFAVIYLAQGSAIVEHYLRKASLKAFARGLVHALIVATPAIVFVIALGVVDIWADVRNVRTHPKTE